MKTMPFRFDTKKVHHVLLFVVQSMGGAADLSRLFLILYLADRKHLAKYGSLVTGDTYLAMKYGPVPFHILSICRLLKEASADAADVQKSKPGFVINDKEQVVAISSYEKDYLASSEVECLFETLREHKADSQEELSAKAMGCAWKGADVNGEISLNDMAEEGGASPEMINYIKMAYTNEIKSFNDEN